LPYIPIDGDGWECKSFGGKYYYDHDLEIVISPKSNLMVLGYLKFGDPASEDPTLMLLGEVLGYQSYIIRDPSGIINEANTNDLINSNHLKWVVSAEKETQDKYDDAHNIRRKGL
jgi:hypothetical protein